LRLVLQMSAAPRQSTSFPTRRSSDLATRRPPSTRRYNACCWAGCSPSASPRPRSSMLFALPTPDVSRAVLAQRLLVAACLLMLRSEEHTSELQSRENLVCRLLLENKK